MSWGVPVGLAAYALWCAASAGPYGWQPRLAPAIVWAWLGHLGVQELMELL